MASSGLSSTLRSHTPRDLTSSLHFPKNLLKGGQRNTEPAPLCLGGAGVGAETAFPLSMQKTKPLTVRKSTKFSHAPSSQRPRSTEFSMRLSNKHLLCAPQWLGQREERLSPGPGALPWSWNTRPAHPEQRCRCGRGGLEGSDSVMGVKASPSTSPAEWRLMRG